MLEVRVLVKLAWTFLKPQFSRWKQRKILLQAPKHTHTHTHWLRRTAGPHGDPNPYADMSGQKVTLR